MEASEQTSAPAPRRGAWRHYLGQFCLIVFSVLLGLYLSERIEEGKERRASAELLTTIESEVDDNIELLSYWTPYHREISHRLDSLKTEPAFVERFIENKYALFEELMTRGTFMARFPASDAWDIAKANPLVVNIDHGKLLSLSRVYNQQSMTFEPGRKLLDQFHDIDVNHRDKASANLEVMSFHLRELAAREEQLMAYYRQAQKALNLP